jgi:D-beta-D-heptose 7-phosphate kinase/D-beta-D-heptose 1-phosphate adenosyltransferase
MKSFFKRAKCIIENFNKQNILVVGDLMLDRYIKGSVNRISPEAPVPVVQVQQEFSVPGGAANIARNLVALGAKSALGGIIGHDTAGEELKKILTAENIKLDTVLSLNNMRTTLKTRIIADRQQVVRIDWEDIIALKGNKMSTFIDKLIAATKEVDGIIIGDYAKGVVSQKVIDVILQCALKKGIPVAMDPKDNPAFDLNGLTFVTPNRKEAFALCGVKETSPLVDPLEDKPLLNVAQKLLEQWQVAFVVITLGPPGMLILSQDRKPCHVPTAAREVFDVSGAGDTAIATLLLALTAGAEKIEAAIIANCAAGVVVGKLGTATCNKEELLDSINSLAGRRTFIVRTNGRRTIL